MKPAAIKVLLAFRDAIPVFQGHGDELRLDPGVDPAGIEWTLCCGNVATCCAG